MHRASTSGENHAAAQPYRSTRGQWQRYPSWRRQSVCLEEDGAWEEGNVMWRLHLQQGGGGPSRFPPYNFKPLKNQSYGGVPWWPSG